MDLNRRDARTAMFEAWPLRTSATGQVRIGAAINGDVYTCHNYSLGLNFIPTIVV